MVERGCLLHVALRLPPLSLHVLASCDMPRQDATDLHGAADKSALRSPAMKHPAQCCLPNLRAAAPRSWCQLS